MHEQHSSTVQEENILLQLQQYVLGTYAIPHFSVDKSHPEESQVKTARVESTDYDYDKRCPTITSDNSKWCLQTNHDIV